MSFRQRQNLSGMLTGLLVAQYVFKVQSTFSISLIRPLWPFSAVP